ncbi:MAG TPA: hypothetical protein VNC39_10765 [Acidocella sp.]|uniref:hypothetical protein n=1 Tax=Acidocella sp. TaxID=50710 RepID=UPI002CE436CB|nr:hypothetical protein [Acidocella sp.]HVE22451.1 hypothetical protein [Acidocella sp.]
MIKAAPKWIVFFGLLAVTGCSSSGNGVLADQNQATVSSFVQIGSTTEDQVRAKYGDPSTTEFLANGDAVWTYNYTHLESDPQNFIPLAGLLVAGNHGFKKELTLEFDSNKKLKSYSWNNSPVTNSTGIFG